MTDKKNRFDGQALLTLGYLCIVAVGMMFDHQYYSHFGINIFEYSDILDFLLAPAKNVELIVFALATMTAVLILFRLDIYWAQKRPKSYQRFNFGMSKGRMQRYRPYIFVISMFGYLFFASTFYGDRIFKKFKESPEQIELTFESGAKAIKGKLIGKNSDYIFLQTADSQIKAIPVSSDVQEIVIGKLED